jgi:spore coat polysaccharide biosynthesis predicted glycosyltransferase SpsG
MTHVAMCCDVGEAVDTGHLVRCLALAEELTSRGATVTFVCDAAALTWAQMQLQARGLEFAGPPATADEYVALLDRLEADAVVFDSALVGDEVRAAARTQGRPVLAVAARVRPAEQADLVVAPSLEAGDGGGDSAAATVLTGLDYALMRNDVLANRPVAPPRRASVEVPRVTGVFADPASAGAGPAVARVLAATGRPFEATFVVADAVAVSGIAAVRLAPRQRIDLVEPSRRLHEWLARSDVVLGAAGPSTDEWLCLGASVGLVWVSEDQVERYRGLMVRRVVVGLGAAADLEKDPTPGVDKLARLLSDARERTRLAEAGWRLVDGLGRARVADALLALV